MPPVAGTVTNWPSTAGTGATEARIVRAVAISEISRARRALVQWLYQVCVPYSHQMPLRVSQQSVSAATDPSPLHDPVVLPNVHTASRHNLDRLAAYIVGRRTRSDLLW